MKKKARDRSVESGRNERPSVDRIFSKPVADEPRAALPMLSFSQLLNTRATTEKMSKGQRTRHGLLAAAAELLEEIGYRDLRVSDINERAGVSNALFYLYFTNKETITREVLTEFLELLYAPGTDHVAPMSVEEAMYWNALDYARRYAMNPGLVRCLLQFGDEVPEFGRLWQSSNQRWLQRAVVRLSREPECHHYTADELWTTIAASGAMGDGFLRALFIDREPTTCLHAGQMISDHRALALFLAKLNVRLLLGREMKWKPPALTRTSQRAPRS